MVAAAHPGPLCFDGALSWEGGELVRSVISNLAALTCHTNLSSDDGMHGREIELIRRESLGCSIWTIETGNCSDPLRSPTALRTATAYQFLVSLYNGVTFKETWNSDWFYNPLWQTNWFCGAISMAVDMFSLHEAVLFSGRAGYIPFEHWENFAEDGWKGDIMTFATLAIETRFERLLEHDWSLLLTSDVPLFPMWLHFSLLVRRVSLACLTEFVHGFPFYVPRRGLSKIVCRIRLLASRLSIVPANEELMLVEKLCALTEQARSFLVALVEFAAASCLSHNHPRLCGASLLDSHLDCLTVARLAVALFVLLSSGLFQTLSFAHRALSHVSVVGNSIFAVKGWLFDEGKRTGVSVIICDAGDITRVAYPWLMVGSVHALYVRDRRDCFSAVFSRLIWQRISQVSVQSDLVVLASPFSVEANVDAISEIITLMRENADTLHMVGAPTVDSHSRWRWPCHTIRRRYWKLQYTPSTTGHTRAELGRCFRADTTSGTRVVRGQLAGRMAASTLQHQNLDGSWLVEIDLLMKFEEGVSTHTCQTSTPLREDSYLIDSRWTQHQASRFDVEAFRVAANEPRVTCLWLSQAIPSLLNLRGLVLPWCYRRALTHAAHEAVAWWTSLSASNFVVPLKSTTLFLWRNPDIFSPWSNDIELGLYSELGFEDVKRFLLVETPMYQRPPADITKLGLEDGHLIPWAWNLPAGHVASLEIMPRGNMSRDDFPMHVELFRDGGKGSAVPLLLSVKHITEAFDKYNVGDGKMFGPRWNSSKLHCRVPGHSACLPDCMSLGDCEFDRFVALDVWD